MTNDTDGGANGAWGAPTMMGRASDPALLMWKYSSLRYLRRRLSRAIGSP